MELIKLFELGKKRETDKYMWYNRRLSIKDRVLCLNLI